MALTIKAKYKRYQGYLDSDTRIKENVIEDWFTQEEKDFLEEHEVLVSSEQLIDESQFDDYEDYENYIDAGNYEWKFTVYVDGEEKFTDYANDYEYITSHMDEIMKGEQDGNKNI